MTDSAHPRHDRIVTVSWPLVAAGIAGRADTLDSLLGTIQLSQPRTNRNLAFFSLGIRAVGELRQIAARTDSDLAEIAWRVRNLQELDLHTRYLSANEDRMAGWLGQLVQDEKDIVEGFLSMPSTGADSRADLQSRLQRLLSVAQAHTIPVTRSASMRDLAKAVDREKEYLAFYKFLSKFVHPSSWLVNSSAERVQATGYRNLLVGLAQVFAERLEVLLREAFGIDSADVAVGVRSSEWRASP